MGGPGVGPEGTGSIPGGSRLQFECELVGVETGVSAVIATFPGGLPNVILVTLLTLSFIPYFLPDGVLPPEIAAFWNRAAMPTDPNVFPPS